MRAPQRSPSGGAALLALFCSLASGYTGRQGSPRALEVSPRLRPLVSALASHPRVEGHAVGVGGDESETWRAARALFEGASLADTRALLSHPSPVVRSYAAAHLAWSWPARSEELLPLLRDLAPVDTLEGCIGSRSSVAGQALHALCRTEPRAARVLARATLDRSLSVYVRAGAFLCAAAPEPEQGALARALVTSEEVPLQEAALHWFACAAQPAEVTRVRSLAASPSTIARAHVAVALGRTPSPEALAALLPLLRDPSARVRLEAARAVARQPGAPAELLRSLLEGTDVATARAVTSVRLCAGAPDALSDAERLLLRETRFEERETLLSLTLPQPPRASRAPTARRLLTSADYEVSEAAMTYLGQVGEATDAALLETFVGPEADVLRLRPAAEALVALRATSAIPALLRALEHPNPNGRLDAARALARLHSREAFAALTAVVEREHGWSRSALSEALEALRAPSSASEAPPPPPRFEAPSSARTCGDPSWLLCP